MKKGVVFVLLLISLISLASSQSQQTLGGIDGFPPRVEINLTQTCSNCTFVNITYIRLGGGHLQKINQEMTKDGTFYNFSLDSSLTISLGEYIVNWFADPDGIATAGNYNFYVRNSGTLLTTAESILYIFLAIFNSVAAIFFLFYGITLPYNNIRTEDGTLTRVISFKYLKLLSIWLGYGALVWLSSIITSIVNNFISLESARILMTNLNVFMYVLAFPLTLVILSIIMIEVYWDMFVPIFRRYFMNVTKRKRRT